MKKEVRNGLLSLAVLGGVLVLSDAASAQSLATSVTSVKNSITTIPNLIAGFFYICGAALIGIGFLKLKAYSENPSQTPIGHGLSRLCVGAALIAAPSMTGWIEQSIGSTGNILASQALGGIQ